jgi:SPP1 gp7 family putative phage head morphogenesis protein
MIDAIPFDLPFDEAIQFFNQKGMKISPESWRDVWQEANVRAFTVSRVTSLDVLTDIRGEVQRALDEGTSLGRFKADLRRTIERKGWFAPPGEKAIVEMPGGEIRKRLAPWRLETIYRTNLQAAYSAGRYKQMMEVADERPYWQYVAVMDARTRPAHAAQNGKVYHHLHPFWSTWYPPCGFNCRCYVKSLSGDDVRERGLEVQTRGTGLKPDEGWRYNSGEELARWDKNGLLPDCLTVDFADEDASCVRIVPGQKSWKDYGRQDLRHVPAQLREPAPALIEAAADVEEAQRRLLAGLGIPHGETYRLIQTPVEPVYIISDQLKHLVEKRKDARERYANYIVPTLERPYEVYMTQYEDGLRSRYIGMFTGRNDLVVIVRVNRDGSLLWNIMQANDKKMNLQRVGTLVWPK